jgi:molecular chaperone HtpG
MGKMKFDFDGLIQLLAGHLYSEKQVFIRELIQNGHDAILRRRKIEGESYLGRINIETRPDDLLFHIQDTGIGMNKADLEEFLSTVGRGLTREEKQGGEVEGLIGEFGIGFLSAFVVAERVEVFTRKLGETEGWVWRNSGNEDYTIDPHPVDQRNVSMI